MSFFSFRRFFSTNRADHKARNRRPRKPARKILALETLEQRLAPAGLADVLPAAIVSAQQNLTPPTGTQINNNTLPINTAPQVAVDPVNPSKVFEIHSAGTGLAGFFSTNNGGSWQPVGDQQSDGTFLIPAPTTIGLNVTNIDGVSIAIDRHEEAYVVFSFHSTDNKNGVIELTRFNISGSSPVSDLGFQVLYSWKGTEPAYNPSIIVDNNVPDYVDPTTGVQTVDSMSGKGVFVAWNTSTSIQLVGSTDGGLTFGSIQTVADGSVTTANGGNHPVGFFTQGTPTTPGGVLNLLYDKPTDPGSNTSSIALVQSRPDNGQVSQSPLPDVFLNQTYDATTGAIAEANPGKPATSQFFFNITPDMFPANFDQVANFDVILGLVHPDVRELSVVLKSPVLDPTTHVPISVTLFNNGLDASGNSTGKGLPGANPLANLGALNGLFPGTVFDDVNGLRNITDSSNQAPFLGSYKSEQKGALTIFKGLTPTQLAGQWELDITDFRPDPPPVTQFLGRWGFRITPQTITQPLFGPETTVVSGLLPSSAVTPYSTSLTAAGNPGLGPNLAAAVDNTLGGFSPHQGTIYVAFTGAGANTIANGDSDVFLVKSTDGGATWSSPLRINNDTPSDNFSEGDRAQFMPELAVDPVTGTLVATWYDARWDASNDRVATFLATSIDGGNTFSNDQVFLNQPNTAIDAITGQQRIIEPIPSNITLTNTNKAAFGDRQGLAVWGGHVYSFWSGNLNTDTQGEGIFTANVTIAAGPRILGGDSGPIGQGGSTNSLTTSTAPDGTPQLTGFTVTFDRPVDPSTITPGQIQLHYHKPGDPAGTFTDLSGQITAIQPLDLGVPPVVAIGGALVAEGNTGNFVTVQVPVLLSIPQATDTTVNYTTVDGSAVAGTDYTATSGTLTIKAGQTSGFITVSIIPNNTPQGNRTFSVQLTGASVAIANGQGSAAVTVLDDDFAPRLTVGDALVRKSVANTVNANFTVFLSQASAQDVVITYSTADGTAKAGTDYTAVTNGQITIAAGKTSGTISIPVLPNNTAHGNLNFFVNVTAVTNAVAVRQQAVGTIVDAANFGLSAGDTAVTQGPGVIVNVPVYLSAPSHNDVHFTVQTVDGSALAGVDYTAANPATVYTIAAGSTMTTVPIAILNPSGSLSDRTFMLQLSSTDVNLLQATANVTIFANGALPTVTMGKVIVDSQGFSVNQTALVPLQLSFKSGNTVTVHYDLIGTPDHVQSAFNQTVTFAPGQDRQNIVVPIQGESAFQPNQGGIAGQILPEVNQFFSINLLSADNAIVAPSASTSSIVRDNLWASIDDATAVDVANNNLTFTVYLNGPAAKKETLNYTVIDGTAKNGTDYNTAATGSVTFNAGDTKQTITIPVVVNAAGQDSSQFTVQLSASPPDIGIERGTGVGTILYPNSVSGKDPVVSIGDVSAFENANGTTTYTFTIYDNVAQATDLAVDWVTTDGNGTFRGAAPTDYASVGGTAVIAKKTTSTTVKVTVQASADPLDRQFFVKLLPHPATTESLGAKALGSGWIEGSGDIQNQIWASIDDATAVDNSGTNARFTVYLNAPAPEAETVFYSVSDGTAKSGTDYGGPATGSVTFAPGQQRRTIFVPLIANANGTDASQFTVQLTSTSVGVGIMRATGTGTIVYPNAVPGLIPIVSIGDASARQNEDGTATVTFTINDNVAQGSDLLVDFASVDGSGTFAGKAGTDYLPVNGTADIAAGTTSTTVSVTVQPSSQLVDRQFFIQLSAHPGQSETISAVKSIGSGWIMGQARTGLIVDSNVWASVDDTTGVATSDGKGTAVFTIYLNAPAPVTETVNYSFIDVTAKNGVDYTGTNGSVTFNAGDTMKTITVTLPANAAGLDARQFLVQLTSASTGVAILRGTGTGTVLFVNSVAGLDPVVAIGDVSAFNGNALTFTIYDNIAQGSDLKVDWKTVDGSGDFAGTAASDYTAANGTATIAKNTTSITVTVNVNSSSNPLPREFFVQLSINSGTTETISVKSEGSGWIEGNSLPLNVTVSGDTIDAPPAGNDAIVVQDPNKNTTANFMVSLSQPVPANEGVSVRYFTSDGTATAGIDYLQAFGTVTFAPGQQTQIVPVTVLPSLAAKGNRNFFLNLFDLQSSVPGATVTVAQATGEIVQDKVYGLSLGDASVQEPANGNTATITFTVSVSAPPPPNTKINFTWSTLDGTAVANTDYVPVVNGTGFIENGTSTTISVTVNANPNAVLNRFFHVFLTSPTDINIVRPVGTGTILEDDAIPTLTVSGGSAREGDPAGEPFTALLSFAPTNAVSVNYSTHDGAGLSGANAGIDYTPEISQQLNFAAGTTARSFSVPLINDAKVDSNESFTVQLSGASGATLAQGMGTGFIAETNSTLPTANISDALVRQGYSGTHNATFTVLLSNPAKAPVTLAWTTADGTALAGVDYVAKSDTVTIAAGQSSATINVAIIGNSMFSANPTKQFSVQLTDVSGAQIGRGQGQGTILNDNGPNGATQFLVSFNPQSLVGDYSYAVGPNIQDRVRVATTPASGATALTFNANGLPLAIPNGQTVDSSLTVPLGALAAGQGVGNITVNLTLAAFYDRNLTITLISPNGQRTLLSLNRGGSGHSFTNTTFDLSAATPIGQGTAPFTGSFQPDGVLNLNGLNPTGTWTLEIADNGQGQAVTSSLLSWSLNITPVTLQTGTAMDQDQNTVAGEANGVNFPPNGSASGDVFAMPGPAPALPPGQNPTLPGQFSPNPALQVPYDPATLPLIIPGPHVVAMSIPNAPLSGDNLMVNGTVNSIDVIFDRDMDASTFSTDNILRIIGPAGIIYDKLTGNINSVTLTPNPSGTPSALAKRTFRIGFLTQSLSGSYSVLFGPTAQHQIKDVNGNAVDTNLNAGLDTLRGFSVLPSAGPAITYANATATTIKSKATTTSTITISDQFVLQQDQFNHIQLLLNITSPPGAPINDPDLTAKLIAPNGTVVTLFSNVGNLGSPPHANFSNTLFDDFARVPIQEGLPPFLVGPFNPQTPLSAIKGLGSKGTWKLVITNKGATTGTLTNWSLLLPPPVLNSGLGEPNADQATVSFRIFTQDPTNIQSHTTWTAIGPAPLNNGDQAGPVSTITFDPSDPSGNTAYAGAVAGGVWKTTNFLSPTGPTWVPLTDLGPTNSLQIGSIDIIPVNNDPNQSMIFVTTGAGNFGGTPGVGLLRSLDGGKTWKILDSLDNTVPYSQRMREFVGSSSFKVIHDPKPLPTGKFALYAAFSGGANQGVYRSVNNGDTWTLVRAGNATDIVLAAASAGSGGGNLSILYAGFQGEGVFITTSALTAISMTQLSGAQGNNTRRNIDTSPDTAITVGGSTAPGGGGNIFLATPSLANEPLKDTNYQGWLYALVAGDHLYLTKDFGANWTQLVMPFVNSPGTLGGGTFPTNDETKTSPYLPASGNAASLAIDPINPNIVYIGGLVNASATSGIIRVDVTLANDANAVVAFDNNDNDGGKRMTDTKGSVDLTDPTKAFGITDSENQNYFNILFDPLNPFLTPSSLPFTNVTNIRNMGDGVRWEPVDQSFVRDSVNIHHMVAIADPLTGKTRLVVTDDEGIFTAVTNTDGSLAANDGSANLVIGSRNGNIQVTRFGMYSGGVQPGINAAETQGALFYGMALDNLAFPISDPHILQNGNLNWNSDRIFGEGTSVVPDPTGSGQVFEYRWPCCGASPLPSDFFLFQRPGHQDFISRINGLLLAGDDPATGAGDWPSAAGANFVVNPFDPTAIIMSAPNGGKLFRTSGPLTGTGVRWFEIDNGQLDGTYTPAVAFGAPNPSVPGVLDDFLYAGTTGGKVFVTTHGDTGWTDISQPGPGGTGVALDGSAIEQLIADPKIGSDDVYVITSSHVYFTQHATASTFAGWTDITGNLFTPGITTAFFGPNSSADSNQKGTTLQAIHALAVDWRGSLSSSTNPVLYVGGLGGIYRSDNQGNTWRLFPSILQDGAPVDGGFLPNTDVTDLKLSLGPINPTTGLPDQKTGFNLLMAMTAGRGVFAIRLDQSLRAPNAISGPAVFKIADVSDATSEKIQVTFGRLDSSGNFVATPVDPSTFTPGDVILHDPNGKVIPVRQIIDVTPPSPSGNPHNVYDLLFDDTAAGTYTVAIGPQVSDFSGNQMDQDNDGLNGGPGLNGAADDKFSGSLSITPAPRPTVGVPFSDGFAGNFGDSLQRQWVEPFGRFQIQPKAQSSGNVAVSIAPVTRALLQLASAEAAVTVQADVDVTSINGSSAGLIARFVDGGNYFIATLENMNGSYVASIKRGFQGALQTLNSATVASGAGTMRFEVVNGSLKLFLNDTLVTYAFDNLLPNAGLVGIQGTQGTTFGNFNMDVISLLTAPVPFNDNFNTAGPGSQLDRYWIDQLGNTADVNGQATGQTDFNLSTVANLNLADVKITADVAMTTGQTVGLVARYGGPFYNNFYLAQLHDTGSGFQAAIFVNNGGVFTTLNVGSTVASATGSLEFEAVGPSLKLLLNGVVVAAADDLSLTTGSVGVRLTKGASLDNLHVESVTQSTTSLPFTDNFTTTSDGSQLSGFWTDQLGQITVTGGAAIGQAAYNLSTVNLTSKVADVKVLANINLAVGQVVGLVARYGGPGYSNFYMGQLNNSSSGLVASIWINNGGTFTLLNLGTLPIPSNNGTLEFEAVGPSLKLLMNGQLIAFADDLTLTSGSVGMRLSQGAAVTSFEADQVTQKTASLPFNDEFTTTSEGSQLSRNWTDQLGNITVTTPAGGDQVAQGTSDFNLSTVNLAAVADVTVQGDVNLTLGSGQSVGLVARYGGPGYSNFYMAQLRDTGSGFQASIWKNIGGTFTLLNLGSTSATGTGTLSFKLTGTTLQLSLGGNVLATITDGSLTSGSVGMRLSMGATLDNFNAF